MKKQVKKERVDWKGKYEAEVEEKVEWRNSFLDEHKVHLEDLRESEHKSDVLENWCFAVIWILGIGLLVFSILFFNARSDLRDEVSYYNNVLDDCANGQSVLVNQVKDCRVQLENVSGLYEARVIEVLNSDVPPLLIPDCDVKGEDKGCYRCFNGSGCLLYSADGETIMGGDVVW